MVDSVFFGKIFQSCGENGSIGKSGFPGISILVSRPVIQWFDVLAPNLRE